MSETRTWLITGASTGFGKHLAEVALERGDAVAATFRRQDQADAFTAHDSGRAHGVLLDVTDSAAIEPAVQQVLAKLGHIDVLVNNAGYGLIAAVEEASEDAARAQFDVNVFGPLNLMQAVLPSMRERKRGHIINMSSFGGVASFAGAGFYCASKFALEGLSEALAQEVAGMGIKVTLLEPGAFRTDWAGRSLKTSGDLDAYVESSRARKQWLKNELDGAQPGDPRKAAHAIVDLADMDAPPLRAVMGDDAVAAVRAKLDAQLAELDSHAYPEKAFEFEAVA
ncbi:MAG: oxidoreductase [Deinococcota bacterium]